MTMPNFLFVGPDKTGSTWVHRVLDAHPDCYVPVAKDLYFFDRCFDRGLGWYQRHFDGVRHQTVIGEVCHDYLLSDAALDRIGSTLDDVRLMVTVRDPVDRAWSQYQYGLSIGRRVGGFHDALATWPALIDNSRYGARLHYVYERFDRSRVLVTDFGDLAADPVTYARSLFEFLCVDPHGVPDGMVAEEVFRRRVARSAPVARTGKLVAVTLRRLGRPGLVGRIKLSPAVQRAFFRPVAHTGGAPTPAERRTIANTLSDDIDQLDELRGLDHRRRWGWVHGA